MIVGAVECEVLNSFGGPDFGGLDEINEFAVMVKVLSGELYDPRGNGCRE